MQTRLPRDVAEPSLPETGAFGPDLHVMEERVVDWVVLLPESTAESEGGRGGEGGREGVKQCKIGTTVQY